MASFRTMGGALRRSAMGDQGALYDLLFNIKESLNDLGMNLSLERGAAPTSTQAATITEINRVADASTRVVPLAVSTSITEAAHDGKTIVMGGAGSARTFTLPAATASGARFRFVVGAVNTSNYLIKVTGDDVMFGNIITNSTGDSPDLGQPWPTAADSDTVTLNGTTTGGAAVGDFIEVEDFAADKWAIFGVTTSSGSEATPFSATV